MAKHQNKDFEDLSSFSSKSEYNRARVAKKGGHKVIKTLIIVLCVLLIAMGGLAIFAVNYMFAGLSTNAITKDKEELGIASGVVSHPEITNIALFGLDARGDVFEGRSDSIMILSLDQIHNKVKLTSILRDSRVYIGDYTDTGYDKINHAYAYGGPQLAIKTLNQNFGLDIQDYITVNFSKLVQIVDAFGGVDMEITSGEAEYINNHLRELVNLGMATESDYLSDTSGGLVHLNGPQALSFSRIRYLDSDNARAERQQKVLSALLEKTRTISPLELPGVVREMGYLCETSLNLGGMAGFIPFAASGFQIERIQLPDPAIEGDASGYFEGGGWMWSYDLEVAANHISEFIYEDKAKTQDTTGESSSEDTLE